MQPNHRQVPPLFVLLWVTANYSSNKDCTKPHIPGHEDPGDHCRSGPSQAGNFLFCSWVFKSRPDVYHKNQFLVSAMIR